MISGAFLLLVMLVFFVLILFVLPKILYFATMLYYALFTGSKQTDDKKKNYTLSDMKEMKGGFIRL